MKKDDYSYCQIIGITDRGLKRAANEDWLGDRQTPNGWVAVVCDGMGGHVGGATASHIAVESILDFLSNEYFEDARIAIGKAIDHANAAIIQRASHEPELQGMGATCVLLIIREGKVYIGHVGDSRIYLIRDHRIHQLTKDHSYVQMLVDMGEITAEQAEHHPRKNEITNALGIPQMQPATVMQNPIDPQAGDCFLMCSDGLSGMVENKTIEHVVSQQKQLSIQERAATLIEKAKEGGGLDNISVQLVEFGATPSLKLERKGFVQQWWFWAGLAFVICALGAMVYHFTASDNDVTDTELSQSEQRKEITINFGRKLMTKSDTILLLTVSSTSDTSTIVFKDANNGYLETITNVAWRTPKYQTDKIVVNYDAMPVNGKINGVVRMVNNNEHAFFIKYESVDCVYIVEVDFDRTNPKPIVSPNKKSTHNRNANTSIQPQRDEPVQSENDTTIEVLNPDSINNYSTDDSLIVDKIQAPDSITS